MPEILKKKQQIAWEPLPDYKGHRSAQALALSCPFDEILFHGTRGSSKTETQIAYFVSRCGLGYGRHWNGVILDRGYKNLEDIISKTRAMIPRIFPNAQFRSAQSALYWEFPDGERLYFRHVSKPSDYLQFHGQSFCFIGFNELTSYPTSEIYDLMRSCNRSGFLPEVHSPNPSKPLPNIPLVTFSTSNPAGPGHNWVKRRWIDAAPEGVPVLSETNIFNPRTQKEELVQTSLVHIFGSYKENIYLDPKYIAGLDSITDPNKRRAWLAGDWEITSGGAIDDLWSDKTHVIERFPIPENWPINRSFDWGSSAPFSVGWWAEANGETVILPNGDEFTPERGSLINFSEWYGSESLDEPIGLRLGADDVAEGIIDRELALVKGKYISRIPEPGPADSAIYSNDDKSQKTIAEVMENEGIEWTKCKKGKGSRKSGLELFRMMLNNASKGEGPGLYFMRNCQAAIALLPPLPRCEKDPDDVATDSNDHIYDQIRYRISDNRGTFSQTLTTTGNY